MPKIIGLTGGIGSGKTTVAKEFMALGIPVYIADDEARKIMDSSKVLEIIKENFGIEIFDGEVLNRKKLADIVFENPEKLQKLNQIIHPLVKQKFDEWLQKNDKVHFVLKEAAILFESGSYKDCDKIITVTAPLDIRIQRVMSRDNSNYDAVLNRINNQWTDEMRIAKSDYIIENISLKATKNQVNKIFSELLD